MARGALYEAAQVMLARVDALLRPQALGLAGRPASRHEAHAKVALARKLATVLRRMWVDGTEFHFGKEAAVAA